MGSSSSSSSSSSLKIKRWFLYDALICLDGACSTGDCPSENLACNIRTALTEKGIHTFVDHPKLYPNLSIPEYLSVSKFLILVISKHYAASVSFLNRLVNILQHKPHIPGQVIIPVFYNLDSYHTHQLPSGFDQEQLTRWDQALTQLAAISGWQLHSHNQKISNLNVEVFHTNEAIFLRNFADHLRQLLDQNEVSDAPPTTTTPRDWLGWVFLMGNLVLEILAATMNQLSSPRTPNYSLMSMVASFMTLLFCSAEFYYMVRKEEAKWERRGYRFWLFLKSGKRYGSFAHIFGLLVALLQSLFSTIEYSFYSHHAQNPVKLSIFSVVFASCLVGSRLLKDY